MSATDRPIERQVTLHATRREVWRALTEAELAEAWLAGEVEIDPCEGGEVVFRYDGGEERRGHVREVVEEERLRIRWRRGSGSESEVEFVLADAAAGTRLSVFELVSAPAPFASAGAWGDRLFALEVLTLGRGCMTAVHA